MEELKGILVLYFSSYTLYSHIVYMYEIYLSVPDFWFLFLFVCIFIFFTGCSKKESQSWFPGDIAS